MCKYLEPEAIDNTYLLSDIHLYGFSGETTNVWIAENTQGKICGIVLRYFQTYICYTLPEDGAASKMQVFLLRHNPFIVIAKGSVADALMPGLIDYTRNDKVLCALHTKDFLYKITTQITVAKPEDALEIARQFKKIEEFQNMYNDENTLADNIAERIRSGEGEHLFIRHGGKIVAHGNSAGIAEKTAFVNGIFTLPEHRGHGYASQIVSEISRRLIDSGRNPVLSYDNMDAGRIYRRLGYEDAGVLSFLSPPKKQDGHPL